MSAPARPIGLPIRPSERANSRACSRWQSLSDGLFRFRPIPLVGTDWPSRSPPMRGIGLTRILVVLPDQQQNHSAGSDRHAIGFSDYCPITSANPTRASFVAAAGSGRLRFPGVRFVAGTRASVPRLPGNRYRLEWFAVPSLVVDPTHRGRWKERPMATPLGRHLRRAPPAAGGPPLTRPFNGHCPNQRATPRQLVPAWGRPWPRHLSCTRVDGPVRSRTSCPRRSRESCRS